MKLNKIIALALSVIMLFSIISFSISASFINLDNEIMQFQKDVGPKINGFALDYHYFSPVNGEDNTTKYPLVIWLHGITDGLNEERLFDTSDIATWASDDYQGRFKGSNGAFILVPRALENKGIIWGNILISSLRATIDTFIEKNKDSIDVSRIYIGGYSLGGGMALKMAVAYPNMFAAIFPVCPKWVPNKNAAEKISNIPVWLTGGARDVIVNYFAEVVPTWNIVSSESNIPQLCRFSTLDKTLYPDGNKTALAHQSWYAVNYDMFSSNNSNYPAMNTINGKGEPVTLNYPDGIISWLSSFTSNYDGTPATDSGNKEAFKPSESLNIFKFIIYYFKNFFNYYF